MTPKFRTSYSRDVWHGQAFASPTLTQQHFKDACDINHILRNFLRTGLLPATSKTPLEGDFSEFGDYRQMLHKMDAANSAFADLPASVRAHFGNNPANMLDAVMDPARVDECVSLGLFARNEETSIKSTQDVTPSEIPTAT